MSKVIAFAGKGGVGKTTVASLVIRYITGFDKGSLLAVDADPNSNLGETMGLDVHSTIGDIRETFMKRKLAIEILGPAPAFIPRKHGKYIFQLILKYRPKEVQKSKIKNQKVDQGDLKGVLVQALEPTWKIDVDPISLL